MKGKNQHVVPHGSEWAVRGAGNSRVTRITSTQSEELLIPGRDGRIRARDSHGNDPFPPKG